MENSDVDYMPTDEKTQSDTDRTRTTGLSGPWYKTQAVIQYLARHPKSTYSPAEIAESLSLNIELVRKILSRLSSSGKNSGPVERVMRGFYRYAPEKKPKSLLDQIIESGRVGIENLSLYSKNVRKGYTPSQSDTEDIPQTGHTPDSSGNEGIDPNRTQPDTDRTQSDMRVPEAKKGFPWRLPTGQEVQWWQYQNGAEMIIFTSNGSYPFPVETVLLLFEQLKKKGLNDGWERTSIEWNIDSKRFSIAEPVSYQVSEAEMLKLYQHGGLARLEGVNRQTVGFPETLTALRDVYERGQGELALKELEKMKKRVELIEKDNRMNNNLVHSLSDRVHGMGKKPTRKERPLV
jgi:hypothetical protein